MKKDIEIKINTAFKETFDHAYSLEINQAGKPLLKCHQNAYRDDQSHHVYSVTKSLLALLVGIAIDKGYLKSVTENVGTFFPEVDLPVTIENLLTMTVAYKFEEEPYENFLMSPNWLESALSYLDEKACTQSLSHPFFYSPMIGTHILSGLLQKAIGRPLLEFAQEVLFEPMKIRVNNLIHLKTKEDHFALMNGQPRKGWVCGADGLMTGGWGLFLSSKDMMKLGQLILNDGLWDNQQLVSAQWIGQMMRVHSTWNHMAYGYLWWVIDSSKGIVAAIGDGGNTLYINKEEALVVSILAPFKANISHSIEWIQKEVVPLL